MAGSSSSGADVRRPSTTTPDDNNAALEEAYQQQLHIVHMLQQKNMQYKEKLAQHEQFDRLIQTVIQHLSTVRASNAPTIDHDYGHVCFIRNNVFYTVYIVESL
ncbi:hypothetical protein AaE_002073 [Aphanomyces astaci]|uniref:Uncharacterized protein n=1 Tax=Aphanomyces astaci TaxID=112090 RepID=A0A6A5AQU9_APHAT|nr:hypothetical protein AaE_002073 [Aphanomyces astaci]